MRSISNRSSFMSLQAGPDSPPRATRGWMAADYISEWMKEESVPRFVRVPAGELSMGSEEGADDQRRCHQVQVYAFYAAVHPVTVEQYFEFSRETGHAAPAVRDLPLLVTAANEASFRELAAPYVWRSGEPRRERARHPVTMVMHADATAYCRWLSGR